MAGHLCELCGLPRRQLDGHVCPDRKPGGVLYPDTLPNPEPCTYIGAGGLVEVKVRPGARLEQLRLARRFLDLLIDLEAKP